MYLVLRRLSVSAAALLILPVIAESTTPREPTLKELASCSSSIVHGRVLSSACRWNEDHSLIVTDARIEVIATVKGAPPSQVVITQPGGAIGKLRVDVPGAAPFKPGEETVLFLWTAPDGSLQVPGLSQGRFDVVLDPRTGRRLVPSLPAGEPTSKPSPEGSPGPPVDEGLIPLDEFLGRVARLLDEPAGLPR